MTIAKKIVNQPKPDRYGVTDRMTRLRSRCRWKHNIAGEWVDESVKVGVERMRYMAESYKQTEGEPEVIRRAKCLSNVLNKMTICIQSDELIVGDHEGNPNWMPLYPELSYYGALDLLLNDNIVEDFKQEAEELIEYWKPYSLQTRCEKYFKPEVLGPLYQFILNEPPSFVNVFLNIMPTYESVLQDGLLKRIEVIEQKLNEAKQEFESDIWIAQERLKLLDKIDLYEAMIISSKAFIAWSRRYSRLARIMAENFASDPKRKEELLQIAEICHRVPAEPCQGFWDSMQAKWLMYVVVQSLERYASGFSHKEDSLHWPYYKASVVDKTVQPMTREQAQELIECERIKISERGVAKGRYTRSVFPGANDLHILTIGGLDENDQDACNELTDVILDAAYSLRTPEPSIGFRWHPNCRRETKQRVFKCIASGLGFPSIKHEELNVRQLENKFGATHKDARGWALMLCMSPGVTGRKNTQKTRSEGGGGTIVTAKCIELALGDGFDSSFSNLQLGPHTGDPHNFKTFEDLFEAFKKHFEYAVWITMATRDVSREFEARYVECTLVSAIDDACVEEGVGAMRLTNIPNPWFNTCSTIDAVDSLAAVKKLVYEEKKYTMDQLVKALKANWVGVGYEEMRQDFRNVPKFGNDDDYVDDIAKKVYGMISEAASKHIGFSGVPPMPLGQSVSLFSALGPRVGALPSGRKHGEVTGDGGISPYLAMDKKGPTAVLKSVSKVDASQFKGQQLNQRLSQALMTSDKGFDVWLSYMNAWYNLNIDHVQFNVVSTEEMKEAQEKPEEHEDLIVRIAGFSAKFNNLAEYTQDSIIARTEQELG